jgi:hypothetical protein
VNWNDPIGPDRVAPRECIANARDALNRAYSHPGISDGRHALTFITEALDWMRRGVEQMAASECQTPGAVYDIRIRPTGVSVEVTFPAGTAGPATVGDAAALESDLHRAVERVLARLFDKSPDAV